MVVFNEPGTDAEVITKAGKEFLLALYGASSCNTLDYFRVIAFKRKNTRKNEYFFSRWQAFHQQEQLLLSIRSEPTARFSSGWRIKSIRQDGNGKNPMVLFCQCQRMCLQHQNNSCTLFRATVGCKRGCGCQRADLSSTAICNCMGLACHSASELDAA